MSLNDLISMALRNLWKRRLRTFLTVLGVVIGTASIVVMVSIGIGMNESYIKQVSEWGSLQVIEVYPPNSSEGMIVSNTSQSKIKNKNNNVVLDVKAIQGFKEIPGVIAATPVLNDYMQLICGKYVADVSFVGIDPSCFDDLGYNISEGRGLLENDKVSLVVGESVLSSFYNPKLSWQARYNSEPPTVDIFNDKVQITYDYAYGTKDADKSIKPIKAEAVGKLSGNDQNGYSVIMPIKQLEKIQKEKQKHNSNNGNSSNKKKSGTYEKALVRVENIEKVQEVQTYIKSLGYNASSLSDVLESMKETTKMLRTMLGAIGAISLVVAAIGITNTMVMSIYERTREIGVMKVIGASLKDIKRLFLTEAAIIGFVGGVFGMIVSFVASKVVNYFAAQQSSNMLSSIPLWLYLASLIFATFVGIASGYLPAKRAMNLSALTAIKTE